MGPPYPPLLSNDDVKQKLGELDGWKLEGKAIVKQYEFKDFEEAMEFINQVATEAEERDHHPDIDIRYNKVRLSLSTHAKGGLTDKDFDEAQAIDTHTV